MTTNEIRKTLEDSFKSWTVTDKYFFEKQTHEIEDFTWLQRFVANLIRAKSFMGSTQDFYNDFGEITILNVYDAQMPIDNWRIKSTFAKVENRVKEGLLTRVTDSLDQIIRNIEDSKKTEIDQLCAEKDKQIMTLEEQVRDLEDKLKLADEHAKKSDLPVVGEETTVETIEKSYVNISEDFEKLGNRNY